jgi:hypothetical protein
LATAKRRSQNSKRRASWAEPKRAPERTIADQRRS